MSAHEGGGTGVSDRQDFDLCLLRPSQVGSAVDGAIESFLVDRGLAARIDTADGVTSLLLADERFRPLFWDAQLGGQLAALLEVPIVLVAGASAPSSSTVAAVTASEALRGLEVDPRGVARELTEAEVAAVAREIPDRVEVDDSWLVVGRIPPGRDLATLVGDALPAHSCLQAEVWFEQEWFLARIDCARPGSDSGSPDREGPSCSTSRPQLAATLTSTIRAVRGTPVLLVRHSSADVSLAQPGARGWPDFPLEWGLRRSWIHPRWGIAQVDQDMAVTRFARAWEKAGGTVDEVNLRALSRRRGLQGQVLRPVLGCLGIPGSLATRAGVLASGGSWEGPAPQVMRGVGAPAHPGGRASGTPNATYALRLLHGLGAVAGAVIAYRLISQGVSGWGWAALVAVGLLTLDGFAGAAGGRALAFHATRGPSRVQATPEAGTESLPA